MALLISLLRSRKVQRLQNKKQTDTMKKIIFSLMLVLATVSSASAQSWKNLLGKVAGEVVEEVSSTEKGSAVTNVLGALLGTSLTLSEEALEGTWNYEGVACILESEDALANVGGSVVTSTLESTLDEKLSKVGIAKGNCSFTFVKGGSCVINVGGYDLNGKYELNVDEKVIVFTFVYDQLPLKTYVAYEIQNLNVVFKADRLLSFIKNVSSYLSKDATGGQLQQLQSLTQTIGTVGTLLENYNGMMLGAKLTKSSTTTATTATTATTTADNAAASSTSTETSAGEKISTGLGKLFKK